MLSDAPADIKYNIALKLDYKSLLNLCLTSSGLNKICADPIFWMDKANLDLGVSNQEYTRLLISLIDKNPREIYIKLAVDNKIIIPGIEKYLYANDILIYATSKLPSIEDIEDEFSRFGKIDSISKKENVYLLIYEDLRDAEDAIAELQDMTLHGKQIKLVMSNNTSSRPKSGPSRG